jgi:hypothetical protein
MIRRRRKTSIVYSHIPAVCHIHFSEPSVHSMAQARKRLFLLGKRMDRVSGKQKTILPLSGSVLYRREPRHQAWTHENSGREPNVKSFVAPIRRQAS